MSTSGLHCQIPAPAGRAHFQRERLRVKAVQTSFETVKLEHDGHANTPRLAINVMPMSTSLNSPNAVSQDAVFAFLSDPATHGGQKVTRIDTHGAAVFLAGERVLKVKRAV